MDNSGRRTMVLGMTRCCTFHANRGWIVNKRMIPRRRYQCLAVLQTGMVRKLVYAAVSVVFFRFCFCRLNYSLGTFGSRWLVSPDRTFEEWNPFSSALPPPLLQPVRKRKSVGQKMEGTLDFERKSIFSEFPNILYREIP